MISCGGGGSTYRRQTHCGPMRLNLPLLLLPPALSFLPSPRLAPLSRRQAPASSYSPILPLESVPTVSLDEPLLSASLSPTPPAPSALPNPAKLLGAGIKIGLLYFAFTYIAGVLERRKASVVSAPAKTDGEGFDLKPVMAVISGALGGLTSAISRITPQGLKHRIRLVLGSLSLRLSQVIASRRKPGTMMKFTGDEWGVASLLKRETLGDSGYIKYTFNIGDDITLPLSLGQTLSMCCLDSGNVVRADFYTHSERWRKGYFTILASPGSSSDKAVLGTDTASFHRVLNSLDNGDEVAIKPGKSNLEYRGETFPVSDMVFLCSGLGVVPMLAQVRELLGSKDSSVERCSVVWVNERPEEFDLAFGELEDEFYKHNRKLEVSCCIEPDVFSGALANNDQVADSIPDFHPGTMAVVGGPDYFVKKAGAYLGSRGYPSDCICSLG